MAGDLYPPAVHGGACSSLHGSHTPRCSFGKYKYMFIKREKNKPKAFLTFNATSLVVSLIRQKGKCFKSVTGLGGLGNEVIRILRKAVGQWLCLLSLRGGGLGLDLEPCLISRGTEFEIIHVSLSHESR